MLSPNRSHDTDRLPVKPDQGLKAKTRMVTLDFKRMSSCRYTMGRGMLITIVTRKEKLMYVDPDH